MQTLFRAYAPDYIDWYLPAAIPVAYHPRLGEKKLRPLQDGFRILARIIALVLLYNPLVTFVLPGLLLILKQPDLGSGLSFLAVYAAMLLMVGVRSKTLGVILLLSVMLFPFVWEMVWASLHDYQRERVMAFVDPDYDPGGKGYHALQSRIAIGSGELSGKGLYGGTQSQLKFLPEGHTDFVFAVYAEEWGFVGVLVLLALFIALIWVSLEIAARAKDTLGALLAAGIVAMLCFCVVVNIGMTAGMFPIVGIPLPLVSYGGSATIMTMASLGLLLNVKRRRLTLFY